MIVDYLPLKKRLKKRKMEERGDLVDLHRDLGENFEPVVASNKMMTKEIVDELTPITKELRELNDKAAAAARQKQLASDSSKADVNSGALRHSVGVFQLLFGTQYFCLYG